jgi:hypothetical protein
LVRLPIVAGKQGYENINSRDLNSRDTPKPDRRHGLIANQIASAIIVMTIAAQTLDVTRFELPLRGESLAAWLNSALISRRPWTKIAAAGLVATSYRNTASTLSHSEVLSRSR